VAAQIKAQQEHYKRLYPGARHDVILSGERQVGRRYVARLVNEIRIVDITVLPAERNRGIGSRLLESLKDEAKGLGLPLRTYVERSTLRLISLRVLGLRQGNNREYMS
jgi:GNAT superfamily N-acetyltransferase